MHFNKEFRFFLVYETFCFVSQTGWEHSSQSYLTMDDDSEIMDEVISEHDEDDIDEDDDPNNELNLSNSFIDGNVEDSTKRQYTTKLNNFKKWLQVKHPQLVVNNKVVYEDIDVKTLKEFFGHISKKRNRAAETIVNPIVYFHPTKFLSYEHVSGYKSAIVHGYKKADVERSPQHNKMLKELFAGYKRKVGHLKQTGEMKIGEGKDAISFSNFRFLGKAARAQRTVFKSLKCVSSLLCMYYKQV